MYEFNFNRPESVADALAAFADAFLAGELTAHIKPDLRDEL